MLVRVWLRSDVIRREQSKENKEDDLADENDETKLHTTTIHFDVLSFSFFFSLCLPVAVLALFWGEFVSGFVAETASQDCENNRGQKNTDFVPSLLLITDVSVYCLSNVQYLPHKQLNVKLVVVLKRSNNSVQ